MVNQHCRLRVKRTSFQGDIVRGAGDRHKFTLRIRKGIAQTGAYILVGSIVSAHFTAASQRQQPPLLVCFARRSASMARPII